MSVAGRKSQSAVARFAPDRTEPEELALIETGPDIDDDAESEDRPWRKAWKTCNRRSGDDLMLDVIRDTGRCTSFSYSELRRIEYDGGDCIELLFYTAKVRIRGRLLRPLRKALKRHYVDLVQEGNQAEEDLKPDDEPHIDSIEIEEVEK